MGGDGGGPSKLVEPQVEVPPKWELLREVLEEAQEERRRLGAGGGGGGAASVGPKGEEAGAGPHRVLVIARHGSMVRQLRQWLRPAEEGGGEPYMSELWEAYLQAWLDQVPPPRPPSPP